MFGVLKRSLTSTVGLSVVPFSGINSLVFEIRFPSGFPHAPPFFRILKPRFLGFSQVSDCAIFCGRAIPDDFHPRCQGGGGHVTLGLFSVH